MTADSIDKFRPIALSNFKFKLITKIIADRLAKIMPHVISKEQKGFIQGRTIKDCICLTSEVVKLLHKKSTKGNLAIKFDINKAFDNLSQDYIIQVLSQFGFSQKNSLDLCNFRLCQNFHCSE